MRFSRSERPNLSKPQKAPPHVTQAILEAVENQVRDNTPPETKTTIARLQGEGLPRKEAVRLVGCLIANEMFQILKHGESFDEKRFIENLHKLPKLPWD